MFRLCYSERIEDISSPFCHSERSEAISTYRLRETASYLAVTIFLTHLQGVFWIEVYEENKKLYEKLLASEREKVEILKNK
jgi:hypothetical protein